MKWLLSFILLLFIFGCGGKLVLYVPNKISKPDKVKILVMPVSDKTNNTPKDFNVENYFANDMSNNFKGILVNPYYDKPGRNEQPIYRKAHNPYVTVAANKDNADSLIKNYMPDLIINFSIEVLEFTNSDIKTGTAFVVGGLIGAVAAENSKSNFKGVCVIKAEIFNAYNELIYSSNVLGESKKQKLNNISRDNAVQGAIKQCISKFEEQLYLGRGIKDIERELHPEPKAPEFMK